MSRLCTIVIPCFTTDANTPGMEEGTKKRVVLFGLSANPPTGLQGHMGIAKYFSCNGNAEA